MMRMGYGVLGVVLALSACETKGSGVPGETLLTPDGANHRRSHFSPDGGRVAYWAAGAKGWDLMVARADLSEPRVLVAGSSSAADFSNNPALWSPDGRLLAFTSSAASLADVAVVPADSGAVRRLTDAPGLEIPIQWHPAGDRLAYIATAEGGTFRSFVVSLASGASSPLLADTKPAVGFWSPDGSRLAIQRLDGGLNTIWLADSTGTNPKQLTTEGQEFLEGDTSPWSPDGKELLYVSRRTGTGDIWVLPVDGGKPRQLTRDVRDDYSPVWSADGKWVAFISTRGKQTDVWVVSAAGGTELRVTDDAAEEGGLQWIGKSHRLAFQTGATASGLWAMTVADGKERRITPDSLRTGGFDVSPDGTEVVYQVLRGGGVNDLQVVSLATGSSRTLVTGTSDNWVYGYSPDGKTVLFGSNRSGNRDVWTVSAAGGEPRQLTTWSTDEGNAAWSSDGSAIYFLSNHDASPFSDVWKVPAAGGEPARVTRTGSVNGISVSRTTPDVFVITIGGRAGQLVLSRLLPEGKLQTLWDRTNFLGVSPFGLTPKGDSVAITAELPGGGSGSYLISVKTGQGRQILGRDEFAGDFSRDGTELVYAFGSPNADLGLYNTRDGSTRRLTTTPENEGGYWWTSDGKTLVFSRSAERRRIATVDVSALLAAAK
jgi:Tol biopolymer transport system component